ncbi:hypothetical protein AOL_s00091g73 [Orbilia oligospora ATCC 24927]|uniref:Uncharacterized protein n=1 Tax=Arthrobotrys oligospora (strain ATCC 24927 / CBS 115.81 / DSM 1491) TaxID=756982 RepID=G1XI21_ARTOA|nr:hypothetical protein AOL_s00091g73 [Orbilia oligospora ATCC 24927]EGX47252.1 hypothetical protein AOL_s00091g73 [Orbilia oligospora ATCC 24927]
MDSKHPDSGNPPIDMADINAERGDDPLEVITIGQLKASFTIEEAAPSLEHPGSPMKRKFSLASQSGFSSASNRDLGICRLAEPVFRLDITKQLRSRNSSPEKQGIRSKSRNSSPDKQSVSARTTVSQGTNSISLKRSAMAEYSPAFVFCHNNRLASGNIPKAVLDFKKRISSAGLHNPGHYFVPRSFESLPRHLAYTRLAAGTCGFLLWRFYPNFFCCTSLLQNSVWPRQATRLHVLLMRVCGMPNVVNPTFG